jgi:CheY-like chemotaxis protein
MISRHTILYAEDDADDLFMVKKAFEAHDHIQIVHAMNGLEALELLESMLSSNLKPCLVILDINMPKLNGRETLVKIKSTEETRDIPVVLFSTSSSHTDKQFAEKWEAELFTKPLHYNDLEEIARNFVDRCNFEINKLRSN